MSATTTRLIFCTIFILSGIGMLMPDGNQSSSVMLGSKYAEFHGRLQGWVKNGTTLPEWISPETVKANGDKIIYCVAGVKIFGGLVVVSGANFCFGYILLLDFLFKATLIFHLPELAGSPTQK